jgi:RNA polymerase sigma factor (sigma-70 family)
VAETLQSTTVMGTDSEDIPEPQSEGFPESLYQEFASDFSVTDKKSVQQLVEKCGKGDPAAIKEFFDIYASDIYNFPIKVFHLDEDAASDYFLYAYERLREGNRFRSFQGRSSFRTWFYTVLRNLVIDWMRTVHEIQTVQVTHTDSSGQEYGSIENTVDPRSLHTSNEDQLTQSFHNAIRELSIDLRVVFKLSFIYYLDLDALELSYIAGKTGTSVAEVIRKIGELKDFLSDKETRNIDYNDKISSIYSSIVSLKIRKEKIMADEQRRQTMKTLEYEIEQLDRTIEKKYIQRDKLLEKKDKGHFIARTPYKNIAEILNLTAGSVSVQMMRASEKIKSVIYS